MKKKTHTSLGSGSAKVRFVAYFTKGLGDVVSGEIAEKIRDVSVLEVSDRFLLCSSPLDALSASRGDLRTIDDIRLLVAGPANVTDASDFRVLCTTAAVEAHGYLKEHPQPGDARWSITISARSPAWRKKPEWDPADIVSETLNGADIKARQRSAVDLRLQVDGSRMHVSLNFSPTPLGKRGDSLPQRLGALRPTVAAALVRIAMSQATSEGLSAGIYDPFCGSGTIVAEAMLAKLNVFASDCDSHAVDITRERLRGIATEIDGQPSSYHAFVHDAAKGFPSSVQARTVVSNLPWGKQIPIGDQTALFGAVGALAQHVVAAGGVCVFLTTHSQTLAAQIRRRVQRVHIRVRRIGLLGQTPDVVVVH